MSILKRIVIGTANWGREYNNSHVDESEQNKIMDYMKEVGIEWLECATAYGTEDVGAGEFHRIVKVSASDSVNEIHRLNSYCAGLGEAIKDVLMAHYPDFYSDLCSLIPGRAGVSIYSLADLGDWHACLVEVPYSVFDRRFDEKVHLKWQFGGYSVVARSIFLRGKCLEEATPRECLDFVLMNPNIDKVIMGVDSQKQLEENIAHIIKMESLKKDDENLLDPRKWNE